MYSSADQRFLEKHLTVGADLAWTKPPPPNEIIVSQFINLLPKLLVPEPMYIYNKKIVKSYDMLDKSVVEAITAYNHSYDSTKKVGVTRKITASAAARRFAGKNKPEPANLLPNSSADVSGSSVIQDLQGTEDSESVAFPSPSSSSKSALRHGNSSQVSSTASLPPIRAEFDSSVTSQSASSRVLNPLSPTSSSAGIAALADSIMCSKRGVRFTNDVPQTILYHAYTAPSEVMKPFNAEAIDTDTAGIEADGIAKAQAMTLSAKGKEMFIVKRKSGNTGGRRKQVKDNEDSDDEDEEYD